MDEPDYELPEPAAPAQPEDRLTIDQIVDHGYLPVPAAEPVEAMIDDRHRVSGLGLEDCLAQMQRRYELYEQHMNALTYTRMRAINAAQSWFDVAGRLTKGADPELERTLRDLDQQQREERLSLWRDVSRLRQQMPEWVRAYLETHRRSHLIRRIGGDRS